MNKHGVWALWALCVLWPGAAKAGGLYFTERGVLAGGRAGAFVAGARGLESLGHNPAGLATDAGAMLADFALLMPRVAHTRVVEVEDAGGTLQQVRSPKVEGTAEWVPFPTLAAAWPLSSRWRMAAGVYSPYFALLSYPDEVEGQPSPSRYTLGSLSRSRMAQPGLWLSGRVHDRIWIGGGVQALIGTFRSSIALSLSPPDRLLAAPEQHDYDALADLSVGPIVAPTASAGLIVQPLQWLRLGLSAQLPTRIDAPATVGVQLPSSIVFDDVRVEGDRADVALTLPAVLRAGVQIELRADLQVELAYVRELWSAHDRIEARPRDISIVGLIGAPERVALPALDVPRGFTDSQSLRLGGEWFRDTLAGRFNVRTGISHERSAVPASYLSLGSLDVNKTGLHIGLGLALSGGLRIDVLATQLFARQVHVAPGGARLSRVNPLSGNARLEAINGGDYSVGATVIGLGLHYAFASATREARNASGGGYTSNGTAGGGT